MRTTITLDDDLVKTAKEFMGVDETNVLIKRAITEMVQREAGRRLAAMGGTMPEIKDIRRRRPWTDDEVDSEA